MPWRGSGLGSERDRHIRNICPISPASRWIKMPVVEMRMQGIGFVFGHVAFEVREHHPSEDDILLASVLHRPPCRRKALATSPVP